MYAQFTEIDFLKEDTPGTLLSLLTKHLYCRFWDECKQTQKDICLYSDQNTSFIKKFIGIPVVFSLEYYEQKEFTVP